jgi:uncharacterized protein YqjF (DUF2071 family)
MTSRSQSKQIFLSAEWRDLVMLNFEVESDLLNRYVPAGTSLDSFKGKIYVSLVGFRFCRTKLLGRFPIPFHTDFDEVNLRFYVRRKEGAEDRRGVVFIAEIVPKPAIAKIARAFYGENYMYLPMKHAIETFDSGKKIDYQWRVDGKWCKLSAQTANESHRPSEGSLEQFITEHYWGYSSQRSDGCLEYHVSHAPWQVWATTIAGLEGDSSSLYGSELGAVIQRRPDSAFVADGSPVIVFKGDVFKGDEIQ